jgi:pyrroline-5-carboxylate reductase
MNIAASKIAASKIAFVGGGNMATALIGGLIAKGYDATRISVIEMSPAAREKLGARYPVRVTTAPDDAMKGADTLVLAVKPQDMKQALSSLGSEVGGTLVISVAAGITLAALSRWLGGHRKIVRCMPNTPGLIGAGISGLFASPEVDSSERQKAEGILRAVGEVVWLAEERLLDPVTAVSASGPAYVFWFIEQLAAAAVKLGIPQDDALKLAKQTVLGAAQLAASSEKDPSQLRTDVTSKGGTTEAALNVFEQEKLAERFMRAVEAASRRGEEMGREWGGKD